MTIGEVSALTRIPKSTLYKLRATTSGPYGRRVGKQILYRRADVLAWIHGRFEPPVLPPSSTPPDGAIAAARYFPWALIAEAAAECAAVAATAGVDRNTINNAVWLALAAAYEAYMDALGGVDHMLAEADALAALRETLTAHLHPANPGHRAEAG
jgi:hypothetical protein